MAVDRRTGRPREAISPNGRIAAYTTALAFALGGLAYAIASWVTLACTQRCEVAPAFGGLVLLLAVPVTLVGVAIAGTVRLRAADPEGTSTWTWWIGILFAVGAALTVTRFPSLTCPASFHLDANFGICIGPHGVGRLDPRSWIWLKMLITVGALALGYLMARASRSVWLTATIAALVWFFGLGWLLLDTLARGVLN